MNRNQMVNLLVENDLSSDGWGSIEDNFVWMAHMLREGFRGYMNYTDEELQNELAERGIELYTQE
jgi:hypothetical protein